MSHLTLIPAYGRDYKTKAAVLADWEAGKDFLDSGWNRTGGSYINKGDCPKGTNLNIRYAGLRKVAVFKA
jgi:hypothetical protein